MAGFTISKRSAAHLIGFWTDCAAGEAFPELLRLRKELIEVRYAALRDGAAPTSDLEQAIVDHGIGAYGVLLAIPGTDRVRVMVAGPFTGGRVPEPLQLTRIPEGLWACFTAEGEPEPTLLRLYDRARQADFDGFFERTGLCALACFPDPARAEDPCSLSVHVRRSGKPAHGPKNEAQRAGEMQRGYF